MQKTNEIKTFPVYLLSRLEQKFNALILSSKAVRIEGQYQVTSYNIRTWQTRLNALKRLCGLLIGIVRKGLRDKSNYSLHDSLGKEAHGFSRG